MKVISWYITFCLAISISAGCTYDTLDEAIEKGIPYEAREIIHKEIIDEVAIVLYTTEPKTKRWAKVNKRMLAVAFFEKDGNEWRNVGPNRWDYYEDEAMNAYLQRFHAYDRHGNRKLDLDVVYGEVNSEQISVVDASADEQEDFNKLPIIETETGRYFFYVGKKKVVRAIAKNGTILSERILGATENESLNPAIPK
ncbi:hypothetical protein CIB95_08725 [Lottiidibacillus patelloidae]|uniref:Uncharacterized protein n=1 Tax=Lottiidibacillus patelloidae TaxID=2670334 RepID=A0A263BUJ2_9BACI|nr:hypothetical protein [Lottiidibacillus patelloidae]OZM56846.1 hypothetical protein CIB95_08725 [Lottiidibacillus patelloidae]